jgi:hypothetical protein
MIYILSIRLNQPDLVRSVLQRATRDKSVQKVFFLVLLSLFKILPTYLICFTIVCQLTELRVLVRVCTVVPTSAGCKGVLDIDITFGCR